MENEGETRRLIVVTGYGSFSNYTINPAQVVVENLGLSKPFINDLAAEGVDLLTRILDVDYENATALSKEICEDLRADFVIHVGVHPKKRCVMLETMAFNDGYVSVDIKGHVPLRNCCSIKPSIEKPEKHPRKTLRTSLNCELLKDQICETSKDVKEGSLCIRTSTDPGRYLCGYIYYCSLLLNGGKSLFVHIPSFESAIEDEEGSEEYKKTDNEPDGRRSEPITPQNLTDLLKNVIRNVLKQIQ